MTEQTETPAEVVPAIGTPEYDAQMAAVAQASRGETPEEKPEETPEAAPEDKPEEKPEGEQEETPEEKPEEKAGEEDKEEKEDKDDETSDAPDFPALFETAASEFTEGGEIGEDTVTKLTEAGIPKEFIDTYQAGVKALQTQATAAAHGAVGGEENWNSMVAWAKDNLSDDKIAAFDESVVNPSTSDLAIAGLWSQYQKAEGNEGTLVTSDAKTTTSTSDTYAKKAELMSDMNNPLYAKDAAFRQQVADKLARSRKAGTYAP